jgi:hypothetical protein
LVEPDASSFSGSSMTADGDLGGGRLDLSEPSVVQIRMRAMSTDDVAPGGADDRLRRIEAVTDAALAHLDMEELLGELLERIRELLGADTAAVLLLDPSSRYLVATAARGIEEEVQQGVRIPLGKGFAGRIAVGETRPYAALGGLEKRYEPVAPDVLVALGGDGFLLLPLGLVKNSREHQSATTARILRWTLPARILGQGEHPAVARSELADLVADADADRSAEALGHRKHG